MSYYATDPEIGAKWYNGETIPAVNTIIKSRLDFIKALAQRVVNRAIGKTEDQTDENGMLKDAFLDIFGKELKGFKLIIEQTILLDITERFAGVAFCGILP